VISPSLSTLLVRNVAVQVVGQLVALVTGLATAAVLSRHLSVDGFGGFNYLFAFTYLFLALNDLGITAIVVREISREPERAADVLGVVLVFRIALSIVSLLLAWVAVAALALPRDLAASLALFVVILPLTALKSPSAIFQSRLKLEYGVASDVFTRVVGLALVLVAVWRGAGLFGVTAGLVAAEAGGVVLTWRLWRRLVTPHWRFNWPALRAILRASLPLGLAGLLVALVNRVDFLMLERMADMDQVGLYGAAYKVTGLVERFPQLVMLILYPVMARATRDDVFGLLRLYRRTLLGFTGIAVPLAVTITWTSPWLLRLLFGTDFAAAAPGLRVLVWSSACMYVALVGGHLLLAAGWERVSLLIWILATALNIGLNFVLIPRWGFVGAAAATSCTFLLIMIVTLVVAEMALKRLVEARSPHAVA